MKPKHPEFEVVFVSQDMSEPDMEKYMADMSMPWPALRYSAVRSSRSITKYAGPGIPCLVVVSEKGDVLSDSFQGAMYVGPSKVMKDLEKLLSGASSAEVAPTAALSVSPAKATAAKSGTGTDWDKAFKKP
jgi:hypothetical protein